jgi:hypothetical protein
MEDVMAMSKGTTIRMSREELVRQLGAVIRRKTDEFERAKAGKDRELEKVRTTLQKACERRMKDILQADTTEKLTALAHTDIMDWRGTHKFPPTPSLNVCAEKNMLEMLRRDTRKSIPVNSNSGLWAMIQGVCEVAR